jgi:DNA repair protein RadB/DNA repair protein RadA/Sms
LPIYTGNRYIDELIERHTSTLLYGPAGSGKTTLLLTIAGNVCRENTCIYVSTEETLHYERVARNPDRYQKALFTEAYDLDELIKVSMAAWLIRPKYIFVDSINAPFRAVALRESSTTKLGLVASLLINAVEESGGKLFASAQVRLGESGELEASGYSILDYYFELVINTLIDRENTRLARVVKPQLQASGGYKAEYRFNIGDEGVIWLD